MTEEHAPTVNRRNILKLGGLGVVAAAFSASTPVEAKSSADASKSDLSDIFDVKNFNAQGDGHTNDTRAINQAIEAASKRGGTVYFPAGTYPSYSLQLKSNIALYFATGATLRAADPANGQGYDAAEPGAGNHYQDFGHNHWHNSLIWGEHLRNVSILGPGRIDGTGLAVRGKKESRSGQGNKAIALKLCHNVTIQDVTIVKGGHFCILLTGVDNFSMDGVVMDTNRDGIDVDCCKHVRISNCAVNSPIEDAIVLKSSYALGEVRATENVVISNCTVSGYATGSFVDDTFKIAESDRPIGRIKIGTETNGGFKNITISNVVFDYCRGLALETVDGGHIEDVTISNISMRNVSSAAFFLRLGSRLRGPAGTAVGAMRRINISNVVASEVDPRYSSSIVGIPGHAIEEVTFNDIRILYKGGLSLNDVGRANPYEVPEKASGYPEPHTFGVLPAYGFYIRHAQEIEMTNVKVDFMQMDTRPAFVVEDVRDIDFHHDKAKKAPNNAPTFVLRDVKDFTLTNSRPVANKHFKRAERKSF